MRFSKICKRTFAVCLALALIVCGVAIMPASAGKAGGYVVDSSILSTEKLSQTEWKFDDNGITLQDGVLVFDEYYDLENPVLSRTAAHASDEIKQALEIQYTITVDEIVGEKQFGLAFGIRRLDRDIDEDGASFLYAQATEKGVGFGLSTMVDGEVVHLKELTHYGSKAKDVKVTVRVTNAGAVTILLGGGVFYAGADGEVTAEGYLGFSSSGGWTDDDNYVKAQIKDFTAYNEYYAQPGTPLVLVADFEGDEWNANEWAANSTYIQTGSGILATNGVLRFEGAGQNSAIAPEFKYSNFEIQYEIFDMKNTLTVADNGAYIAPSIWQQLSWGTDGDSAYGVASYYGNAYCLIFSPSLDTDPNSPTYLQRVPGSNMSLQFYKNLVYQSGVTIPDKYDFSQPGFDPETRVQVRLVNMDGTATLYMKLETEVEWTQMWSYSYENGIMPLGYIALRGEGNQFAASRSEYKHGSWYSLDNIMIKNYDKNPTVVTVDFKSNRLPPVPDYDYKDPYVDTYLISHTGGKP